MGKDGKKEDVAGGTNRLITPAKVKEAQTHNIVNAKAVTLFLHAVTYVLPVERMAVGNKAFAYGLQVDALQVADIK